MSLLLGSPRIKEIYSSCKTNDDSLLFSSKLILFNQEYILLKKRLITNYIQKSENVSIRKK